MTPKFILEAINRGIQLALDDYEDDASVSSNKSNIIKNNDAKELWDIYNNFIDLGLPSGTMWCKYNLGCDWDKLNIDPEHTKSKDWYGNYYAWGEIKPKDNYDWNTYKFLNNYYWGGINGKYVNGEMHKYVVHSYGDIHYEVIGKFEDNITELMLEDDAAYQYDKRFKMPTKEQYDELIKYTNNGWIRNYQEIEGLNGSLFTSKINGNELFIPAAGAKYINSNKQTTVAGIGNRGYVWASSLFNKRPDCAYNLMVSGNNNFNLLISCESSYALRFYGMSIRPVLNR